MIIRILIILGIVSIIIGVLFFDNPSKDWIDSYSIVIAVLVVVLVGSISILKRKKIFINL